MRLYIEAATESCGKPTHGGHVCNPVEGVSGGRIYPVGAALECRGRLTVLGCAIAGPAMGHTALLYTFFGIMCICGYSNVL